MCVSDTVYTTLFYYYFTIILSNYILKLLIINHLLNTNTIYNYKLLLLMYLSDCKYTIYKEATKLVFFFDKVKLYNTNIYKHRSKPKILQRVGNNLNYKL